MTSKIIKTTVKGQITLPKKWRSSCKTDNFMMQITSEQILIRPLHMNELEEVLFDADRDNEGKGVSPDEIITLLKKIKRG